MTPQQLLPSLDLFVLLGSDAAAEDQWVDHFTGQEVDTSLGLYDGGRQENCALLTPAWGARWPTVTPGWDPAHCSSAIAIFAGGWTGGVLSTRPVPSCVLVNTHR